ncbi:MAG TPA: sensor histidine kinase KdpD [Nitrolancea sp.]|jgi:two-component system sensor histidine kinase KdpD|nr:sensor histidine kinase KdpD [Nitrolancea sp.]
MSERERIDGDRPTPEQILERMRRAEKHQRGRLRVFLGAAPGVGKTYAMLEEGHRLRDEGHDVVAGFIETYRRAETEAQIGDLEVVPRWLIPYHGVILEELDTNALLARHPEIVLVDELAHTNAPGSAREKRYQDVEILLEAGIVVISTMNIQHLEGLNDLIEGVTGVKVRETVPDRVLDEAEVELVDLSPSLLRERLEAGKVYPEPQAVRALENFFRESNLTALRELALQRTAEGVQAALEGYMRGEEVPGPWPTIERVMACFDARTDAESIVRHAWRLARGLHADLLAVSVIKHPLDNLPAAERETLTHNIRLAEDLGARVFTVVDSDVIAGLSRIANANNITDIVIGRPEPHLRTIRRSILDRLLARLDCVDVHVVSPYRTTCPLPPLGERT